MILLSLDTCGMTGTLALARVVDGAPELLAEAELAGRTTAAMLTPTLDTMLREAGLALSSLTGIVVVDGPGSFTGIRIGLSAAKGLAEALAIPVFAVSRLRVLAAGSGSRWALLDAGRGEFYSIDEVGSESLLTLEEVQERVTAGAHPAACEAKVATLVPAAGLCPAPTAQDAVRLLLPEILAGQSPADIALLDGRYLRRSDLYRVAASLPVEAT